MGYKPEQTIDKPLPYRMKYVFRQFGLAKPKQCGIRRSGGLLPRSKIIFKAITRKVGEGLVITEQL